VEIEQDREEVSGLLECSTHLALVRVLADVDSKVLVELVLLGEAFLAILKGKTTS
jgi:hypothetical protein